MKSHAHRKTCDNYAGKRSLRKRFLLAIKCRMVHDWWNARSSIARAREKVKARKEIEEESRGNHERGEKEP